MKAGLSNIPCVTNEEDYIPLVKKLLEDEELAKKNYELTVQKWDFPKESFGKNFERAVS